MVRVNICAFKLANTQAFGDVLLIYHNVITLVDSEMIMGQPDNFVDAEMLKNLLLQTTMLNAAVKFISLMALKAVKQNT